MKIPVRRIAVHTKINRPRDLVAERYSSILAREDAWDKQLSHARSMLKAAKRERRLYEKRHGERLTHV